MSWHVTDSHYRWATAEEVDDHLNAVGGEIEGAVWVLCSGDMLEGTAQFDLAVPIYPESF
jgi:hypothetical protein